MRTTRPLLPILALALAGCMSDPATTTMTLGFAGVPQLGDGYVYEGWIMVDGAPVSAGRFTVDEDSNPIPGSFEIDADMAERATAYILTIEPEVGDDPAPSDVHLLAGELSGGTASLTVSHPAALGTDFTDAAGEYILETPSSMAVADDYDQGIWWLIPGDSGMAPGLELPELPAGWVYEGWVVGDDGPVSTGTFSATDVADSDEAGNAAGPDDSPAFPGQDFVDPARLLTGGMAVISVEPVPDDSPMPFVLKPLVDMDVEAVMAPSTQSMANEAVATNPSGTVGFASAE